MAKPFRNPNHLPTKICPACGRAFTWRKKWARDWEQVKYCSDACRRLGDSTAPPGVDNSEADNKLKPVDVM